MSRSAVTHWMLKRPGDTVTGPLPPCLAPVAGAGRLPSWQGLTDTTSNLGRGLTALVRGDDAKRGNRHYDYRGDAPGDFSQVVGETRAAGVRHLSQHSRDICRMSRGNT